MRICDSSAQWIQVTTPVQLFYYLSRGEVVAWRFFGGEGFLHMDSDNTYLVLLRGWLGNVCEFRADSREKVEKMFGDLRERGIDFWVCPGAALVEDEEDAFRQEGLFRMLRRVFRRKSRDTCG